MVTPADDPGTGENPRSPNHPAAISTHPLTLRYSGYLVFVLVLFLNLWIFRYFLVTALTAASVAMILNPLFKRLCRTLNGRRSLAAALSVALTTVLILVPLTVYAMILGDQVVSLYELALPHLEPERLRQLWEVTLPGRYAWLTSIREHLDFLSVETLTPALSQLAAGINRVASSLVITLASVFIYLMLFLLMLFFFLRDSPSLTSDIKAVMPFSKKEREQIFDRAHRTVKGVLYSMVVVPLVQGALAVLGFGVFGLPSAFFWGAVLVFAAVIPGVGAPFVWIPAAVYLIFVGSWWQSLGLMLYGVLVIGIADNIIKPMLLHGTAQIHPLLAFLAILGGLITFGPVGFLVGPVILSVFLSIAAIYRQSLRPQSA